MSQNFESVELDKSAIEIKQNTLDVSTYASGSRKYIYFGVKKGQSKGQKSIEPPYQRTLDHVLTSNIVEADLLSGGGTLNLR